MPVEIKTLDDNAKSELNKLIPEFETCFQSHSQRFVRSDFDDITTSGKITMRVLCKLSEWCNYPEDGNRQKYRNLAINISKILFGDILPKLHSYLFVIEDGKIIINL
ncbi:Uncharacterised protein [uncultured archaeon]|nr:Uncharacterised protein [uncultured archaeon]